MRERFPPKVVIDALPTGKKWHGIGQLTAGVVSNQLQECYNPRVNSYR